MKCIFIVCLITIINANISNDSLAVLIKDGHIKILQNVEYIDPLIDKNFGIEINPLYTLAYSEEKLSFSGTVSLFPKNRKVEIAFPFSKKSRSNYNFERSIQYNTRQFQCNSCPAGSLFKFSTHRPSHGFRARRATGTSLPEGHLPLLLLPYLMLLHHTNVARRQPILATRP